MISIKMIASRAGHNSEQALQFIHEIFTQNNNCNIYFAPIQQRSYF